MVSLTHLLIAGGLVVSLTACGSSNSSIAKRLSLEELDRVKVPRGYDLIHEGETDTGEVTFQYRLYAADEVERLRPPGERYQDRPLLSSFRRDWEVLQSWVGLNDAQDKECLVAVERPKSDAALDEVPGEAIEELGSRTAIRIEARCGAPQHSFD